MEPANKDTEPPSTSGQKRALADGKRAREEKRRKWDAKQARKHAVEKTEDSRSSWISENAHFASLVSEKDAEDMAVIRENPTSQLETLLAPYVDVQDTRKYPPANQSDCDEHLFVAEGTETIRLLIQQSTEIPPNGLGPIVLKSIFVKPSILFEAPVNLLNDVQTCQTKRQDSGGNDNNPGFHVLVGSETALSRVAGFPVSRGAMACGVIPRDRNESWLKNLIDCRMKEGGSKKIRLLALDGICDTANLGSMIRCASAFGVDALVLSKDCCEAWYRRSIRVSMGHIFRVPVVRVENLSETIQDWSLRYPALHSFAAVIDTDTLLETLGHGTVPSSWCCVMGNESQGISPPVARACTQRIRIDMEQGVDSLSVPIACGILLHGLKEREGKQSAIGSSNIK